MESRLEFIRDADNKSGNARAVYRCSCGVEKTFFKNNVRSGKSLSWGCLNNEVRAARLRLMPSFGKGTPTHGLRKSPEYTVWWGMKSRCEREKNDNYSSYGGRGIRVCDRWQDFAKFYEDMGPRPEGGTIDRIDNDGNYEAGNCRWVSMKVQASNRRKLGG